MSDTATQARPSTWADEGRDLIAAASGGLLFGIPMLFTMEVWWTGTHTTARQIALVLALTFVPVLLLNRTDGFRRTKDIRLRDAATDTVEAVALGLVLVFGVLVLLREITPDTPLAVGLGKVVYEAFPFCIGISVANHFLQRGEDEDANSDAEGDGRPGADDHGMHATLADMGATAVGAVFIALNISPTDEVPMISAALGPIGVLAIMAASLLVSYGIVFVAGFTRQQQRHGHAGPLQRPWAETVSSYLIALACAGLLLLLFQRLDGPWTDSLDQIVVLGLPAAIGGAAGRLAL